MTQLTQEWNDLYDTHIVSMKAMIDEMEKSKNALIREAKKKEHKLNKLLQQIEDIEMENIIDEC
jgi:ACT domain-containing protein